MLNEVVWEEIGSSATYHPLDLLANCHTDTLYMELVGGAEDKL